MHATETLEEVFRRLPGYHDDEVIAPFRRKYIGWAPGDDYMNGKGWAANVECETWEGAAGFFGEGDPDLNVIADFYFNHTHDASPCEACDRTGYNPETKRIADDFYDFGRTGRRWCDDITQDEVEALVEHGRLWDFTREFVSGEGWKDKNPAYTPTAEEVNAAQRSGGLSGSHDAINRWILIEARAKRLGVWGKCSACGGNGELRTGPDRLELVLWVLHPRKGASRGVTVRSVSPDELPTVKAALRAHLEQTQMRFAWALSEDES